MKLVRSILFGLLLAGATGAQAKDNFATGKDFAGHWEGVLHVTVDGKATVFPFVLDIAHSGFNEYGGYDRLSVTFDDGQKAYIKCTISGSVSSDEFSFKDKNITRQTLPNDIVFYWCVKSGTLHFVKGPKGEDVLEGPVNGDSPKGDCLPATAELRRIKK